MEENDPFYSRKYVIGNKTVLGNLKAIYAVDFIKLVIVAKNIP
jgi:hypothetical protein